MYACVEAGVHKPVWEVRKVKVGEMEQQTSIDHALHLKFYFKSTLKGKELYFFRAAMHCEVIISLCVSISLKL